MNEKETLIFNLLQNNVSLNKIQDTLQIPNEQFIIYLKNIRANYPYFKRKLDSNGTYFLIPSSKEIKPSNRVRINLYKDNFKLLLISDLHIGNKKDRPELLDLVFEHAASKGINYIANTGDVIENIYYLKASKLRLKTLKGQLSSYLKNYPYDPNIITINLYGNHDLQHKEDDLNIEEIISRERHDIISLGYGQGFIDLKKDFITLEHNISNAIKHRNSEYPITFRGHSHKTKYDLRRDNALILVPSLSDALPSNYSEKPLKGFLETEFKFDNTGHIKRLFIKEYTIEPHKHLASEMILSLRKDDNND